jgi:2,4-dienoyl-CoA reductase (NADPH2)
MRFAVEIVRRVREACGPDFIIIYRLSLLDLVEDGNQWDEIVAQAKAMEAAGATIINTGIGWHEARVPTIATSVPRAAFVDVTAKLRRTCSCRWSPPTASTCRTWPKASSPTARPTWCRWRGRCWPTRSGRQGARRHAAGHQHLHRLQPGLPGPCVREQAASCLVNPRACHETELNYTKTFAPKRIAVVGAGPGRPGLRDRRRRTRPPRDPVRCRPTRSAGSSTYAKRIPGKEEFHETLRYFRHRWRNRRRREAGTGFGADCWPPDRLRRGRAGHRHRAAQGRLSRASITPRWSATWTCSGPGDGRRARRHHRRRRHRLRRGRIPGARGPFLLAGPGAAGWPNGAWTRASNPAAAW